LFLAELEPPLLIVFNDEKVENRLQFYHFIFSFIIPLARIQHGAAAPNPAKLMAV
jgi:hypothetical protein